MEMEEQMELSAKDRHFLVSFLRSEAWIFNDYADILGKGEIATHEDVILLLTVQVDVIQAIIDTLRPTKNSSSSTKTENTKESRTT